MTKYSVSRSATNFARKPSGRSESSSVNSPVTFEGTSWPRFGPSICVILNADIRAVDYDQDLKPSNTFSPSSLVLKIGSVFCISAWITFSACLASFLSNLSIWNR